MIPEDHEFLPGKIYTEEIPEGFELENVCAYWKTTELQCIKSKSAHMESPQPESQKGVSFQEVKEFLDNQAIQILLIPQVLSYNRRDSHFNARSPKWFW